MDPRCLNGTQLRRAEASLPFCHCTSDVCVCWWGHVMLFCPWLGKLAAFWPRRCRSGFGLEAAALAHCCCTHCG